MLLPAAKVGDVRPYGEGEKSPYTDTRPQKPPKLLASMDDPTIYGPVVYSLGLADAIDRGILADYRIVVPVINDVLCRRSLRFAALLFV